MDNSLEAYTQKYDKEGYGLQYPDGHVIRFYERILKFQLHKTSGNLLDFGCGNGIHSKYFKNITEYRNDLTEIDSGNYFYEKPLKINLVKDIEHMPFSDYRSLDVLTEVIKEVANIEVDGFFDVKNFFEKNGCDIYDEMYKINIFPGNLSGYADFTQSDPRPIKNKEDKVECLVKIDSNLRHDITIGDSGILFSFISEEDIKAGNFENAIVDWDCC